MFHRTRSVLMASVILVLGFSSFAVARTGDPLREGVRNGTTTKETSIVANLRGYATRQSNKSATGGGAIYGCRSTSAAGARPCVRANNLSSGKAFEFRAASAPSAGTITVGIGGDSKKPFTTNATGVADGLNADRVDSLNADQIVAQARATAGLNSATVGGATPGQLRTRWLLINRAGEIEAQSGGFSIVVAYPAGTPAAPNVYINAGEDLSDNGIAATLALQNQGDNQGAPGSTTTGNDATPFENLEFSGEITTSRCQIPGIVECGPAAAKNLNSFVVSPRLSDGQPTTADTRKRFYVTITE